MRQAKHKYVCKNVGVSHKEVIHVSFLEHDIKKYKETLSDDSHCLSLMYLPIVDVSRKALATATAQHFDWTRVLQHHAEGLGTE